MTESKRFRMRVQFESTPTDGQIDALMEVFALATSISGERLTVETWAPDSIGALRRLAEGLAEACWESGSVLPEAKRVLITALRQG